jgi:hypothetical protein
MHRADELRDPQLLLAGESLEDRHAADAQIIHGHVASLPESAGAAGPDSVSGAS